MTEMFELREPSHYLPCAKHCVLSSPQVGLPGINCWGIPGACGAIWSATNRRIRTELPLNHPLRFIQRWPVLPDEFNRLVKSLEGYINEPKGMLLPGTDVSLMHVRCNSTILEPFEWFPTGSVMISEETMQLLMKQAFEGWSTADVIFDNAYGCPSNLQFKELLITQSLPIVDEQKLIKAQCKICGRIEYNDEIPISIDFDALSEIREGLFRLNSLYTTKIFVSGKVRTLLQNSRLTNFELVPINQALDEMNEFRMKI